MRIDHYNVTFYLPVERKEGDDRPKGYSKEVGQGFVNAKGQITVKLLAVPLAPWNGELRLFPVEAKEVDR